jgi:phosphonopyruvate decarboxylase
MIDAGIFVEAARARGFLLWSGVPCSYLTPFINYVLNEAQRPRAALDREGPPDRPPPPRLHYVGAANEGDAVAIAAGADLGGMAGVVMLQNSGLGNAVNPLTSLTWTFRIPVLLIVTWRGEPGGAADEPQHELMGEITPRMLDLMGIPWAPFPRAEADIGAVLDQARNWMRTEGRPFALVMGKGSVAETALEPPPVRASGRRAGVVMTGRPLGTRSQLLAAVQMALKGDDVLIATTGYTGRELYALNDLPSQLYMVGSMGCAASLGLGLAIARPDKRVVVIDGDGAALMRLGAMTTIAHEQPQNLLHLLFDNGMHESTGGQATVAHNVDFCSVAAACGYPKVFAVGDVDELRETVDWRSPGLRFVHVPVCPGVPEALPRPHLAPHEVARRFRAHLGPRYDFGT